MYCQSAMQARVRSPVAWPSGPLFPTAERGVVCFQCQVFVGGDSWVSAAACAAPGLSLLLVVPKTEEQGAVGVLKP